MDLADCRAEDEPWGGTAISQSTDGAEVFALTDVVVFAGNLVDVGLAVDLVDVAIGLAVDLVEVDDFELEMIGFNLADRGFVSIRFHSTAPNFRGCDSRNNIRAGTVASPPTILSITSSSVPTCKDDWSDPSKPQGFS